MTERNLSGPTVPSVIGSEELVAKQSDVDTQGGLRSVFIDGVVFRPTRPVPHQDGHVTEVARASWEAIAGPVVQVHITTTFAGRIRAWGLHQRGSCRCFGVIGSVRVVVSDGGLDSSTKARVNQFTVSEKNPGLLI